MREIPLKKFRAQCLAILDRVQKTKEPVVITRHGRPLAKLVPINQINAAEFLGRLEGIIKVVGDIESPIWPESDMSRPRLS
jgi:prevent-host-death family protein